MLVTNPRRDVIDTTGLKGNWEFEMSFVLPPPSPEPDDEGLAAAVDGALEKYLGLKMDFRKVPVEMIVIDHLDRTPADN